MGQPEDQQDPILISVREAAKRLGIGRDTTYGLVREGKLPSIHIGRRVLVPAAVLGTWVQSASEAAANYRGDTQSGARVP